MHKILEYAHFAADKLHRYGITSVQPHVLQDLKRARLDPRLQSQPDNCMEVSVYEEDLNIDGSYLSRAIPLDESGRIKHRDRSR